MTTATISAIVLNWNRAALLENCIRSFLETLSDFDCCIIIDNHSVDHSAEIIRRWAASNARIVPMLQPENRGAEWINDAIRLVPSDLVLILANDKVLLPGWADYARRVFRVFPEVAQLALHGPAPLDDEVWVTKPARYRYRDGVGLFEAIGNTGMSSVLRRSLFDSGEIVFQNIDNRGPVRLPGDGRLGANIQERGFISAWSDRYYCLNVGHTFDELRRDMDYYNANYDTKPWLTRAGFERRISEYLAAPKPQRSSRIFGWRGDPESIEAALPLPSRAWSVVDGGGPSLEAVDFIYSLCRLVKPAAVSLVRAWTGHAAVALAQAIRDNGIGHLTCFEEDVCLQGASIAQLAWRGLGSSISWNEQDQAVDFLVVSGHFEPDDEVWALDRAAGALTSARHVVLHGGPTAGRLLGLLPPSNWTTLSFPTPRSLVVLSRIDG